MDNASDYESGDCRFDPCQSRCYIFDNFGYSVETNLGVVDFQSINIVITNIIHLVVSKATTFCMIAIVKFISNGYLFIADIFFALCY